MDSGYNSSSSLNLRPQAKRTGEESLKWFEIDRILADLDRRYADRQINKPSTHLHHVNKELQTTGENGAENSKIEAAEDMSSRYNVGNWLNFYEYSKDNVFGESSGVSGAANYMRQSSWPVPERTPVQPLHRPAPAPVLTRSSSSSESSDYLGSIYNPNVTASTEEEDAIRLEHLKILFSLPRELLAQLWKPPGVHHRRGRGKLGCGFCRNNGEQHTFYLSHDLKDQKGRITCPVLRAYVCARCGSTGDDAHTLRYCPFSTLEERLHSLGLNQGLRLASGRLRPQPAPEPSPPRAPPAARAARADLPLQPAWAALERKLNLF